MKEPTLKFQLLPARDISPSLKSYVGGKPYMEKDEKYPCCKKCKHSLNFIFQLYIPKGDDYFLYSFYYCYHCEINSSKCNYEMIIHKNPSLDNMKRKQRKNPRIDYLEFDFHPSWSLPEWDVLQSLHPDLADDLSKEFKDDAWVVYENTKENLVGIVHMEPFSFFGGYPQFLGEAKFPTCKCCKKPMNLWIQLDSYDEFGLTWADAMGCLYVFQCSNGNDEFQAFIQ